MEDCFNSFVVDPKSCGQQLWKSQRERVKPKRFVEILRSDGKLSSHENPLNYELLHLRKNPKTHLSYGTQAGRISFGFE